VWPQEYASCFDIERPDERQTGFRRSGLSFVKNFAIREPMKLQFRAEMYNAFNHTQFSGVDSTSRFDAQGLPITNSTFGQVTSARTPRQMQLALRFVF
jgi:hypothetical protein